MTLTDLHCRLSLACNESSDVLSKVTVVRWLLEHLSVGLEHIGASSTGSFVVWNEDLGVWEFS